MTAMSCFRIERTANQSWLYYCSTGERKRRILASLLSWQWHCICLSLETALIAFRETLFAKNFIAQSDNIKTLSSRKECGMLCLHFSSSWARIMRAIHSLTFSSVTSASCRRPSSLSLLIILEQYFPMVEWNIWIASFSASQSLNEILWSKLQSVQ